MPFLVSVAIIIMMWAFDRPFALLLLIPLWVAWWFLQRESRHAIHFTPALILARTQHRTWRRWALPIVMVVAASLLVLVLALPYQGYTVEKSMRTARYFMLNGDVSGSMGNLMEPLIISLETLMDAYEDKGDSFDLVVFADQAKVMPAVNHYVIKAFIEQAFFDDFLKDVNKRLAQSLGGGTEVERGLWRSFHMAMLRTQRMTPDELQLFYWALLEGNERVVMAMAEPISLKGGVFILVSDMEFASYNTMEFPPDLLLRAMRAMDIRLYAIKVNEYSVGDPDREIIINEMDAVWTLTGSKAQIAAQLKEAIKEIDTIAAAPLVPEEELQKNSRVPHVLMAVLVVLALSSIAFALPRFSPVS